MKKSFEEGQGADFEIAIADIRLNSFEEKLEQASFWVDSFTNSRSSFSLKFDHQHLPKGQGESHRQRCLKVLAAAKSGGGR